MDCKKLPKPSPSDYERRAEYDRMFEKGSVSDELNSEYLELMNSFDWGADLVHDGDKVGLRTALGEILVLPVYEDFQMLTMHELKKGSRVVASQNGKWGVLICDGAGSWLIEPGFDYIGYPNNFTHVCKDGKWGVIDLSKKEYLIAPECEMVYGDSGFMFINRIGFYKKDGKYGVVGDWGAFTEPVFEDYDGEPDGSVRVKFNGEWGFVGEDNKFTSDDEEAYYFFSLD
jgi:hypothetical protein